MVKCLIDIVKHKNFNSENKHNNILPYFLNNLFYFEFNQTFILQDLKKKLGRSKAEKVFRPWWDEVEDTLLNTLVILGKRFLFLQHQLPNNVLELHKTCLNRFHGHCKELLPDMSVMLMCES
jgi:hypothetical protein